MSDKIDKMKCDEVWWDFALSKDPMPLQSTGRMQLRRVVCSILKVLSPNAMHKSRNFARTATLRIPCRWRWEEKLQKILRLRSVFCFRIQSFQGFGA